MSGTAAGGYTLADVTALVLAGGRGLRMGGVDKGLQPFRGVPLAQNALERLAHQQAGPLAGVVINANRNAQAYGAMGREVFGAGLVAVVPDQDADFAGPLSGFLAGLRACSSPLMLSVPCDSPLFPLDLAQRLLTALQEADADLAVVHAPEAAPDGSFLLRAQPVFCLMRTAVAPGLQAFMAQGGRKVGAWMATLRTVAVVFEAPAYAAHAFANANSLEELRSLESL